MSRKCAVALLSAIGISVFLPWVGLSWGQDYPIKPVRVVVPNVAGSAPDIAARLAMPEMAKAFGQPLVIENRPGAGQLIGLEYVARQAPADGYTILLANVETLASLPVTISNLRFDPLKELPPFITLVEGRYIFGSASRYSWKNFNELLAYAKANPGKLNYGASSPFARLLNEAIISGLSVVYVPYSAGSPSIQAIGTGEVQMGLITESQAISFGDRFRVLAVTGDKRLSTFADVPTFVELGRPEITGISFSLNTRVGTPPQFIGKLRAAASASLLQPETKAQYAKAQFEIVNDTSEIAARKLSDVARLFAETTRKAGIKPE